MAGSTYRPTTPPDRAESNHGDRQGTRLHRLRPYYGPTSGLGSRRPGLQSVGKSIRLGGRGGLMDPTEPLDYDPMEDSFSRSYEPEEAPITGGALPQELMARAADIFRRHLGFEEPETQPQKAGRVSKLTATGEMSSKPKTTMPVDATCYDRFEAIADKNRWTAFPARADRAVRVPDEAWRALFKCPTIPQEAKERLKADMGPHLPKPLRLLTRESWKNF
ncbi:hypothetical protein BSL78_14864 [Apostichopus japonicus]|uniref:Uncharacterized protein n=1 Tax=Stichopus japonicus TaxID=307972 RepID=A0A2G8KJS4_STIJA|nr:hypothetical protein BSL78_14864 [Apostichopus japonicus]